MKQFERSLRGVWPKEPFWHIYYDSINDKLIEDETGIQDCHSFLRGFYNEY